MVICVVIFFFQAEDGIRFGHVTGVQTCALPGPLVDDLVVPLLQRLPLVAACPVAVVVDRHDNAVTVREVDVHTPPTVDDSESSCSPTTECSLRCLVTLTSNC